MTSSIYEVYIYKKSGELLKSFLARYDDLKDIVQQMQFIKECKDNDTMIILNKKTDEQFEKEIKEAMERLDRLKLTAKTPPLDTP